VGQAELDKFVIREQRRFRIVHIIL